MPSFSLPSRVYSPDKLDLISEISTALEDCKDTVLANWPSPSARTDASTVYWKVMDADGKLAEPVRRYGIRGLKCLTGYLDVLDTAVRPLADLGVSLMITADIDDIHASLKESRSNQDMLSTTSAHMADSLDRLKTTIERITHLTQTSRMNNSLLTSMQSCARPTMEEISVCTSAAELALIARALTLQVVEAHSQFSRAVRTAADEIYPEAVIAARQRRMAEAAKLAGSDNV